MKLYFYIVNITTKGQFEHRSELEIESRVSIDMSYLSALTMW